MQRFHEQPDTDRPPSPGRVGDRRATWLAAVATMAVCVTSPLVARATGDGTWYSLPLLAGLWLLWRGARLTRAQMGLTRAPGFYRPATLQPLVVVGCAVWLATLLGGTQVGDPGIGTLALQVLSMTAVTTVGTLFTEDGFFRGALWGLLERAGRSTDAILVWTSAAGAVWFLPILWLEPGLGGSPEAVAVHVVNVWLLGMCWGALRLISGSVLVAAWAHGLWNGLAYTLFGFGPAAGALGVSDALRFDPERGWAGVAFNAAAFLVVWRWWGRRRTAAASQTTPEAPAR